jgi:hypothetical protein
MIQTCPAIHGSGVTAQPAVRKAVWSVLFQLPPHFSLIGVPSRLDSTVLRRCGLESSRQEVADLNAFHLGKYG